MYKHKLFQAILAVKLKLDAVESIQFWTRLSHNYSVLSLKIDKKFGCFVVDYKYEKNLRVEFI